MTTCKSCKHPVTENFCAHCGQPATLKRIDKHYISHEIQHLLHFEKGVFYTVKELFTHPGSSIREFINDNRNKHMKPVAFLVFTSLLYVVISHLFHADEIGQETNSLFGKSTIGILYHWVETHYGYANIMMGIFIAMCVKLLFKKYTYNLFEITILLCFVMGQGMLLLAFEAFFSGVLSQQAFLNILVFISFAYPTWAIGQFFDKTKVLSYVKAFFAYVLGYLLFYITLVLVGLMADVIIKLLH